MGVSLNINGKQNKDMRDRIGKSAKICLKNSSIGKKRNFNQNKNHRFWQIYRYECESWVRSRRLRNKTQETEMKDLRKTKSVTMLKRIRNERRIRNKTSIGFNWKQIDEVNRGT